MDIAKIRKKLKAAKKSGKEKEKKPEGAQAGAAASGGVTAAKEKVSSVEGPSARAAAGEEFTEHAVEEPAAEVVEEPEEGLLEFLTFTLSGEEYAITVSDIEEILGGRKITPVPRTEPFILGVASIRGKIVPVLGIKARLSLSGGAEYGGRPKTVLLNGPKGPVGVQLPGEMDILSIRESEITKPPGHLGEDEARFIAGVAVMGKRHISVIRTEEMLNFKVTGEAQ
jgi:purine-binding chemotaxis protein CheW